MDIRFHGVFSMTLLFSSLIMGLVFIAGESTALAIVYGIIIIVSFVIIVYAYCPKCNCRFDSCAHILPGLLTKILPEREQTEYTNLDMVGVILPLAITVLFPILWLWQDKIALAIYLAVIAIGIMEIRLILCPKCSNAKCTICPKQNI